MIIFINYKKIILFLFVILSCISVACAIDINESNDNDMYTTTSVNYDNNIKQDMDKDINNMEVIPDNNFEDGFENSEII